MGLTPEFPARPPSSIAVNSSQVTPRGATREYTGEWKVKGWHAETFLSPYHL
jgi:hypothetical protein